MEGMAAMGLVKNGMHRALAPPQLAIEPTT